MPVAAEPNPLHALVDLSAAVPIAPDPAAHLDVSVRTRIIVLALIPVIGFLANGLTYIAGERDVGSAFADRQAVGRARRRQPRFQERARGDADRVKDFVAQPDRRPGHQLRRRRTALALHSLDTIAASVDRTRRRQTSRAAQRRRRRCARQLRRPGRASRRCSASPTIEGLRGNLRNAGNAVERIINENMSWLAEADAHKLHDVAADDAALRGRIPAEPARADAASSSSTSYKKFTDTFANIDGTPPMKRQLERAGEDLRRHLRRMDRRLRPASRPLRAIDRHRQPEHAAARRRDHRRRRATPRTPPRPRSPRRRRAPAAASSSVGIAVVAARPRLQLADRPQHHAAAERPRRRSMKRLADGDTIGAHSGDARARRDRRHGAHRDRVPRHHDRARTAGRRRRPRPARAREQRSETIADDHRAVQALGRQARSASCAAPRMKLEMQLDRAQQRRRRGLRRGAHRRAAASAPPPTTSPRRRARSRNWPPRSARSPRRPRTRPRSPAAPSRKRSAPSRPCRSSAAPPPASARWSG